MRITVGLSLTLFALAVLTNCGRDKDPAGPTVVEPGSKPMLSGGGGSYTYLVVDSFVGTNGTNIIAHTANTGQSWSLSGGFTDRIKIENNTAQLASGADANNWRMAITTDVADDTFDIWTDYTRGSQDVNGDYGQLEFLAKSGANPPTDRVYVAFTRASPSQVVVRVVRTLNFSIAQSVIVDFAFPFDTGATKRIGATITGLTLQVWWEPAGGGTRTNIGSPVTLTADYRDGLHKRVAFNFIGAQAFSAGSPWMDNFVVAKPAPPPPPDTAWTYLTDHMPTFDTSRLATLPGDTLRVFRTDISMTFNTNVTDAEKRTFFANHSMTHIQVTPTARFFVRIPDRGSADSVLQTIASLGNEPQIARAGWVLRNESSPLLSYRFPVDGPGLQRADWVPSAPTALNTWAMRAIHAPLAWGCETGDYDNTPVRLGILELKHQSTHPEFVRSNPQLWQPPDDAGLTAFASPKPQADVQTGETHATATSGLLAAEGNNNSGIAGLNWRSDLRPYAVYSAANRALPFYTGLFVLTGKLNADAPRVLSVSIDQTLPPMKPAAPQDTAHREESIQNAIGDLSRLLHDTPGLLIVVAAGNERYRGTVANYFLEPQPALLRLALLRILRDSAQYRGQILVVAGSRIGNNFWDVSPYLSSEGSNFFTDVTEIAAPAQDVRVLDYWTGQTGAAVPTISKSGTSLAAPLVAGVAGLLLAMDPSLTAPDVKDLIIQGAQQPRSDDNGNVGPAQQVAGAPQTVYQVDAYGSLKLLAAKRQHIPLCGNRVWVANNKVTTERDPATVPIEDLITLSDPRSYINIFHGGRRIEVSDDTSTIAFEFQQDHWVPTQSLATTSYGGTFVSMEAWSHGLDTLVRDRYWTSADTAFFEYTANTFNPFTQRIFDTLQLTLARFEEPYVECVRRTSAGACNLGAPSVGREERVQEWIAYAPVGNRLFAAVTYLVTRWVSFSGWSDCPLPPPPYPNGDPDHTTCRNTTYQEVSERSDVWAIDLTNGAETFLWTAPDQVYWLGVSEDGGQIVSGEGVRTTVWTWQPRPDGSGFEQVWSNPGTVTGCGVHFRSLATGAELRSSIPTTDGCTVPTRGNGTIAPAPRAR